LAGRKQQNKIEKTLKEIDWRYVAKITETNLQKNFKRKNTGVYSGLE